jgi:hypothetical protein
MTDSILHGLLLAFGWAVLGFVAGAAAGWVVMRRRK